MAKEKKLSARQEAGLVEKDYERQPDDEVVAAGEAIDHEVLEIVGDVVLPRPSEKGNPYMSEEEQDMEMTPQVMGPPQYGSPDPATSAGRLLPLTTHPLRADLLPEGHPAAISEDYGQDVQGTTHMPSEASHPLHAASDLDADLSGGRATREAQDEVDATETARELAAENGVDLRDVEGTGKDGRVTQDDVKNYLAAQEDDNA